MFTADQYQLVDFGEGRKLERFGPHLLDRPSPAAEDTRRLFPAEWQSATARYTRLRGDAGDWSPPAILPDCWPVTHGTCTMELKPNRFGHLGIFPEQAANWDWLQDQMERAGRPLKLLNLFAYTGGSTLAAASRGASVVHVDAAQNVVNRARRNAQLSGLGEAPIRWIAEDALKFVDRELRRGNRYDAVIADPPSYGHGPKGETWKIVQHLAPLMKMCRELTDGQCAFVLLTCHSAGFGPRELRTLLIQAGFAAGRAVQERTLFLASRDGRKLPSGALARIPHQE